MKLGHRSILTLFREPSVSLTKLISILGSTNSGSNNVHLKPFSASIFKFFIWIIATISKIYTKDYFRLDHSNPFQSSSRTFTRSIIRFTDFILNHNAQWTVEFRLQALAQSIFGANPLGRFVVTRYLEDFDFHDHLPAVSKDQHPFWVLN